MCINIDVYHLYIISLSTYMEIPNNYTPSLHQSESTLLAVEVVERFAEGHASVELQLLGAFCQSEVGKGWFWGGGVELGT